MKITGNYDAAGLFGWIEKATVKNVGMENAHISTVISKGTTLAGAIAGSSSKSVISNCYNTGSVSAGIGVASTGYDTYAYAGGICGAYDGELSNCYNTGDVTAESISVAGGSVGTCYAGGICGRGGDPVSKIFKCYNTGSITAVSNHHTTSGGIIGEDPCGTMENCFNTGVVSASSKYKYASAGGISGKTSNISNCYNAGDVSAASEHDIFGAGGIGGLFNYNKITTCYWISGKGVTKGLAGGNDTTTPLTSAQMRIQASFAGFDFSGVWAISPSFNDGYPYFKGAAPTSSTPPLPANPLDSASSWARDAITAALAKGFVPAEIQDSYTNTITRQEFCRMAVKWVEYATGKSIDVVLSEQGKSRDPNAFSDTSDADILAAFALGITSGTGERQFTPNGQFSREQAATMIMNTCRAIGADVSNPQASGFADLGTASTWAVDGINFVHGNGIMQGTGDNKFSPKASFTREQSIITFNNIKHNALPGR